MAVSPSVMGSWIFEISHRRDAKDAEGNFFLAFHRKQNPSSLCVLCVFAVNL